MLTDTEEIKLALKANEVRRLVISMLEKAGSGHSAGSLGMADIFVFLYFHAMNHWPQDPSWVYRDYFLLSNGHICPVQYATMALSGYFDKQELFTLRELGSRLQGHPHRTVLPGIEMSSGPLGSGLSQAVGMAYADKKYNKKFGRYFFTLMGDGELNEGVVWESALHAGKEKLGNLIVIVDRNNIQIDGYTHEVMPLEPLKAKWESFNFHCIDVSGHDFRALDEAIEEAKSFKHKPTAIIAHTVPGKGVSFMENDPSWHGKPPDKSQAQKALKELEKQRQRLEKQLKELTDKN